MDVSGGNARELGDSYVNVVLRGQIGDSDTAYEVIRLTGRVHEERQAMQKRFPVEGVPRILWLHGSPAESIKGDMPCNLLVGVIYGEGWQAHRTGILTAIFLSGVDLQDVVMYVPASG